MPVQSAATKQVVRSELELLELHLAELLDLADVTLEVLGGRMGSEGVGVGPSLANEEYIGARGALKDVISYATLVLQGTGSESLGGLEGGGATIGADLNKNVEAYHVCNVFMQ